MSGTARFSFRKDRQRNVNSEKTVRETSILKRSVHEYRIFSNKRTRRLFDFEAFKVRRLKEGGAYFKVRQIVHMKFQIFVIFSFQITTTVMIYSPIYSRTDRYFFCFIVCLFVHYTFRFSCG